MFQLNQFNLQTVSNTGTLGEFVIRPLPRGFGISVANMIEELCILQSLVLQSHQ